MPINLDKTCHTPLYQQLAGYVRQAITEGKYPTGVRLPTEEQLAREASVSKGTAKLAYTMLRQEGLLSTIRGSGSYVADNSVYACSLPEEPLDMLTVFFTQAYQRGIPAVRVYKLFFQEMELIFADDRTVYAALLDCNWETLHVIGRQLEQISGLHIFPYQEHDLLSQHNTAIRPECRFIITTQLHYPAMVRYAGRLGLDIEPIAIVEQARTIAALSRLPTESEICLVYRSDQFKKSALYALGMLRDFKVACVQEDDFDVISSQAAGGTPLVVPPDYMEYAAANTLQVIERAKKTGVSVIPLDYEVEYGSLLRLEQKIQQMRKGL